MKTEKIYAVFFDLDRTIISMNSGKILVKEAFKRGLMNTMQYIGALYLSILYKLNLRDASLIIGKMGEWVKGKPASGLKDLCSDVAEEYLIGSVHTEIYDEIEYHRRNGADIVLLSSSISFLCDPVAQYLGIKNVICSKLEEKDGILTGQPEGNFCYGPEKGIRLIEYCMINGFNSGTSWHYGDSVSDLSAFEASGTRICVNPDKKLRKIGLHNGWRIENWS